MVGVLGQHLCNGTRVLDVRPTGLVDLAAVGELGEGVSVGGAG
ncbi:hypothetical protein ACFY2R_22870 [Micromonospora olivasterospora]|nr:hypothetical protein [Micromonospora olivasterospora]